MRSEIIERFQRGWVELSERGTRLVELPPARPDQALMSAGEDLDRVAEFAISRDRRMVMPVGAGQFGEHERVAGSDFAPDVECRCR